MQTAEWMHRKLLGDQAMFKINSRVLSLLHRVVRTEAGFSVGPHSTCIVHNSGISECKHSIYKGEEGGEVGPQC